MSRGTMVFLIVVASTLLGSVAWDAAERATAVREARASREVLSASVAIDALLAEAWPTPPLGSERPVSLPPGADMGDRFRRARAQQAWDAARLARAEVELVASEGGPWLVRRGATTQALPWSEAAAFVQRRAAGRLVWDGSGRPLDVVVPGPQGPLRFAPADSSALALAPTYDLVRTLLASLSLGIVAVSVARRRADEQARERVLQRLSHDLRTPAASVRSLAAALRNDAVPPDEREQFLGLLDQEAVRLASGLDRMLRAARGEPLVLQVDDLDLAEWIENAQLRWLPRLPGLTLEAPASLAWRADRQRLDEAVDALLDNARKYGGPEVVLSLTGGDAPSVAVSDNGEGLSEDDRVRVFGHAERGQAASRAGGYGLGLWAAREVAEAHRGRLSLDGRARFVMTLGMP